MCIRCNEGIGTAMHRRWQCKANDRLDHWSIRATANLKNRASNEFVDKACLWLRGLLPSTDLRRQAEWVDEAECTPTIFGNLDQILEKTGTAASDGSGGVEKVKNAAYMGVGVAVVDLDTGEAAGMFSLVPGRQSVPRAEVWALWHIFSRMQRDKPYKLIVDAS